MNAVEKKAIEYVVECPKLLGFAVISFLSGHLWYFIISTYYKRSKKGNTLLNNKIGKLAVGGFYNVLVFYPFHLCINKSIKIEWEQMLDLVLTTMLFSMILQIIIFGLCIKFAKEI
jgi:hypothetical protein